ncbi:peroxisomal membrane protein PMP22 [Chloropicon primus]|uniref:Peroxisomal membrane protein PMP22 n=1 Tax=Chloropicon primus TaxID=1764295 RepID=A0A5B8MCL2_9CHLO|nr:peroxisomal membrane protein PMP22 [Chloropicon primus]UPQ97437.1 peroxisomal membrane protein PMP22 [Chloropicon primus]|eukprot:QDZ18226.1 peroxisomal membrane protein PMP22 [Chloropicon primus]
MSSSSSSRGGGGVLEVAWGLYLRKLERDPVRTKAVTAACIQGCSDAVAQKLSGAKRVDSRRAALMALFGLVWAGPGLHYWQKFLEGRFRGRRQNLRLVLEKAFFDQSVYGPVANLAMMSFITLLVEGKTLGDLKAKVKKQFLSVQLNAYKVWPLASIANYSLVPPELRVLFMNGVGFLWSTFLILSSQGSNNKSSSSSSSSSSRKGE